MRYLVLVCCGLLLASCVASSAQDTPKLSDADKALLDKVAELVVKPTGECIRFKAMAYSCWGGGGEADRLGWLERDAEGKPLRVRDVDGDWMGVPGRFETVKFLELCKSDYGADPDEDDDTFREMTETSLGPAGAFPDLVVACWCRQLGDNSLAAKVLRDARRGESDDETIGILKQTLAWRCFAGSAHAFINGDDEQALHYASRFEQKYADFNDEFGTPAADILADLKRRKEAGTFGKYQPTEYDDDWNAIVKLPEGYESWEETRQLDWLLLNLENVDARQWGQPGGVDLSSDWRVQQLIKLGEAGVPKLIDCIESDKRLTRSMHFWRDFATSRTVMAVREAALVAVMTILQVEVFDPVSTGDNFSSRGEEGAKKVAARLRKYWEEYGKYPFDERMMKILTNPEASLEARQEAALNLAYINDRPVRGTTVWTSGSRTRSEGPNPVVEKFKEPTVAEAILTLMDQHVAQIAKDEADDPEMQQYYAHRATGRYADALVTLDDKRIVPELRKRIDGDASPALKRTFAWVCLWLDDDAPFKALCKRFAEGTEPGLADSDSLAELLHMLARVELPEVETAMSALLKPEHPAHAIYRDQVLNENPSWTDDAIWFAHRSCITLLRKQLDNTKASGSYFKVEGDTYTEGEDGSSSSGPIPDYLKADPDLRKSAQGRWCDDAAMKLNELVGGLPRYNPLFSDAETRLQRMRELLDQYAANLHRADEWEAESVGEWGWGPFYLFSPPPLGRAAAESDVKAGNAVFALQGSEVAALKLPARGALSPAPEREGDEPVEDDREWCLIVQAETDAEGKTWYGVVRRHGFEKVAAEQLHDVQPRDQR